jgi:hemerythrin-like domain-containing protein
MSDRNPNRPAEEVVHEPREFEDPIEFIYAEHERIRICIERLGRLAGDPSAPDSTGSAADILDMLENGLPRHIRDEEEDLFPLLEGRCPDDDKAIAVMKLLQGEHQEDVEVGRALIEPLRVIVDGVPPPDPRLFTNHVRAFTLLQRRHMAMENNLVLPLAYERLTDEDKNELACRMAARRGLSLPG